MMPSKVEPEEGPSYRVVDDFLPDSEAATAWAYFSQASFAGAHHPRLQRVFRLYDGQPFVGPGFRREVNEALEAAPLPAPFPALYASLFSDPRSMPFIEQMGHWEYVTFQAYIYPPGTGLNWHFDGSRLAAFIYYAHPSWSPTWGGELLIADRGAADVKEDHGAPLRSVKAPAFSDFYTGAEEAISAGSGIGTFIIPRPNRLVLIRAGVPHCIKKVDAAAGEGFRASISGFFGVD